MSARRFARSERMLTVHRESSHPDPALALVRSPASLRVVAIGVAVLFVVLTVLLAAVPWQQSALGVGRVIAYAPEDREQVVEATVTGVIATWLVSEGDRVEPGTPIAELRDNDEGYLARLEEQRDAIAEEQEAILAQIRSYEGKLASAIAARDLQIAESQSKVASLERKRIGEATELEVELKQLERVEVLQAEGLSSSRTLDLARMKRDQARATLEALDREIAANRSALGKAGAEGEVKVQAAVAELETARAKLADLRRKQLELDNKVARQEAQLVVAPRAGRVLRLHGGPGAGQVKPGDPIATLVPDTERRAVEVWIDGNDVPLVQDGADVRLVFEGWPALQFVGLPGASNGTFGGEVAFVDATDDGKGRFRVVVLPDEEQSPWPDAALLRQGVRVKGWVLLGQVPLGYEMWRRINGFPPLPTVEKGDAAPLPSAKKPRIPGELK